MNIRPATAKDMEAIRKLSYELDVVEQSNQPEHFTIVERTDDMLLQFIEADDADYPLAEDNGEVIGFMLVQEKEIGRESGLIPHKFTYAYELIVDPARRKTGAGQALIDAVKDWTRQRGLSYFKLSVLPENQKAYDFYVKNGFENVLITMECKL